MGTTHMLVQEIMFTTAAGVILDQQRLSNWRVLGAVPKLTIAAGTLRSAARDLAITPQIAKADAGVTILLHHKFLNQAHQQPRRIWRSPNLTSLATALALASLEELMAMVNVLTDVAPDSASHIKLAATMNQAVGVAKGKCRTKATAQMHLCQGMSLNHLSQQLWQEKRFKRWISSIFVLVWPLNALVMANAVRNTIATCVALANTTQHLPAEWRTKGVVLQQIPRTWMRWLCNL
jgi:hypothetical protein